jgi:hypothetical protein
MVIRKSTCAVAVRAPAPFWKFDSAVASMGAAMAAAASTLLMNTEVRMMVDSYLERDTVLKFWDKFREPDWPRSVLMSRF